MNLHVECQVEVPAPLPNRTLFPIPLTGDFLCLEITITVIAWDGQTIAADKRSDASGLARTVTKLYRVGNEICSFAGSAAVGMTMVAWAKAGYPPDKFPRQQDDKEDFATFVVLDSEGIRVYENTPEPIRFEDKVFATGSGRDYAMAALYLGKSAKEAVEVASVFDSYCGNGVDVMSL